MSSKDSNDAGLMSSAGLVRYFDADEGIKISPESVVMFGVLVGFVITILNIII